MVTIARTCPSPGVAISSAMVADGSSPANSAEPRTRLCHRPNRPGPRMSMTSTAGVGNITPPGWSKCPESRLRTSIAHEHRVPKPCVVMPIRP